MEKITLKVAASNEIAGGDKVEVAVDSYADVSDGYHTIEELYDHRITLYIALCRMIDAFLSGEADEHASVEYVRDQLPWRAKLHHDGTGYDGWFMLAIGREVGKQISYHIPMSRWDETEFAETFDKAPVPFDGHTSADVLERLKAL